MDQGPLLWAARNGTSLGFGGLSRLGFVLWYVVPVASLLSGAPLLGAGIWAMYGFARAAAAGLMIAIGYRLNNLDRALVFALENSRLARRIAAAQLVVIGVVTVVIVGL